MTRPTGSSTAAARKYGHNTPIVGPIGHDGTFHPVSAQISGLEPATTYHYRLIAFNFSKYLSSGDRTFTTPSPTQSGQGGGTAQGSPAPAGEQPVSKPRPRKCRSGLRAQEGQVRQEAAASPARHHGPTGDDHGRERRLESASAEIENCEHSSQSRGRGRSDRAAGARAGVRRRRNDPQIPEKRGAAGERGAADGRRPAGQHHPLCRRRDPQVQPDRRTGRLLGPRDQCHRRGRGRQLPDDARRLRPDPVEHARATAWQRPPT